MSDFKKRYNPNRSAEWNYGGGKWRLSRSKIELFNECPRCFYLDNKLGTARPRGPAFTINIAVDTLLKKEFDLHRADGSAHPLMKHYGVDAVPFDHRDIDTWRENFEGLEYHHEPTGFTISGAVDDIWVKPDGELIVVDYKATSKDGTITTLSDSSWEGSYKRQMGVYQWLLRNNGFKVSDTGYFVYANAGTDNKAFDGKLDFEVTLVSCEGDTTWIDDILPKIKKTLDAGDIPPVGKDCEYCPYREAAGKKLLEMARRKK
ncbi:MAG TPA: PD-(D/E)XK nuclease family protein [Candidatus Paceibacterota bacterium]